MTLVEIFTQGAFPDLIYNFFLPFVFAYLILYSVIRLMKLFSNRISAVLAAIITIFFANTEAFVTLTTTMANFTGGFAVALFFSLIIFGAVQYALGKGRGWQREFGSSENEVERLNKEIAKQEKKLHDADDDERDAIEDTIEELEKKRDRLLRRRND